MGDPNKSWCIAEVNHITGGKFALDWEMEWGLARALHWACMLLIHFRDHPPPPGSSHARLLVG